MKVFLSYSTPDHDAARRLKNALEHARPGVDIFFAPQSLLAGDVWQARLANSLAESDILLLLLGRKLGPWQERECQEAQRLQLLAGRNGRPRIVPVALGSDAALPGFVGLLHTISAPLPDHDDAIAAIVSTLDRAPSGAATPDWSRVNPYKGLASLAPSDAPFFFGREAKTAEVLQRIREQPNKVLVLVGNSGVGKSSLMQAGVIDALRTQRWPGAAGHEPERWTAGLADSHRWTSPSFRPGEEPLQALALAFVALTEKSGADRDEESTKWVRRFLDGTPLHRLAAHTSERLAETGNEPPKRYLIYVDQGEELYARAATTQRAAFSALLAGAATRPEFVVMMSLRADYYGRLQEDTALFNASLRLDLPPMTPEELAQAIGRPAARLGVRFETDDAPERLAKVVADHPGALPLLSDLLADLWRDMRGRNDATLRWSHRMELVDISATLRQRADKFLSDDPACEAPTRRLFTLRLAHTPAQGEPVRRRARRGECDDAEWAVAETLADQEWRLLSLGVDPATGEATAEVAHEQLLRSWPTLRQWLDDAREFLVWKGTLEQDRRDWEELGRAISALLMGQRLTRARYWSGERGVDLSPADKDYIDASEVHERAALEAQAQAEAASLRARLAQQEAEANRQRAEAELLKAEAERQKAEAERQEEVARRQQAEAEREAERVRATADRQEAEARRRQAEAEREADRLHAESERQKIEASRQEAEAARLATNKRWLRLSFVAVVGAILVVAFLGKIAVDRGEDASKAEKTATDAATAAGKAEEIAKKEKAKAEDLAIRAQNEERKAIELQALSLTLLAREFLAQGSEILAMQLALEVLPTTRDRSWSSEAAGILIGALAQQRERLHLRGHTDHVNSATLSPDSTRVLTASTDKTAAMWDAATGRNLRFLRGHKESVLTAVFSPDGRLVLTGSVDRTAWLWDARTGQKLRETPDQGASVGQVRFSADGARMLTVAGQTTRIWDVSSGRLLQTCAGHEANVETAEFAPDGLHVLTASSDETARLCEVSSGREVAVLRGHKDRISSAIFSPDGKRILTVAEDAARIWDAASREELFVLRGHESSVYAAAFSNDGLRVVTGSKDQTARVWDAGSGAQLVVLRGHKGPITSTMFSDDGSRVLTAGDDGTIRIWETSSGRELIVLRQGRGSIRTATFFAKSTQVLSAEYTVRIWDLTIDPNTSVMRGHEDAITSLTTPADGERILTGSADRTARLWTAAGRQTSILSGHEGPITSLAFSADSSRVATASADKTVRVWETASGREIAVLREHTEAIASVQFSADGKRVLSASSDGFALVWEVGTGRRLAKLGTIGAFISDIRKAVFSPDGEHVLTAHRGGVAMLWRIADGSRVFGLDCDGPLLDASFSADGERILTATGRGVAQVFDARTGRQVAALLGHSARISTAVFSKDRTRVLTASDDTTARVWDSETGKVVAILSGHEGHVVSAVFSADGTRVLTASADNTARLWEVTSDGGRALIIYRGHGDAVTRAVFSSDNGRVFTASEDGTVRIWYAPRSARDLVALACERLPRPMTVRERRQYVREDDASFAACRWLPDMIHRRPPYTPPEHLR